jgi:hypothetical protein
VPPVRVGESVKKRFSGRGRPDVLAVHVPPHSPRGPFGPQWNSLLTGKRSEVIRSAGYR